MVCHHEEVTGLPDDEAAGPDISPPTPRISWGKRVVLSVVLLAVVALPCVIGLWLGHREAAFACLTGTITVLASASFNGLRAARFAVPVALAAVVLGAITKPVAGQPDSAPLNGWLWVVVVAFFAALSGLATQRGAGVALSTATLAAVVAPIFRDFKHLGVVLVFLAIGSLYGWVIGVLLGAPARSPVPRTSPRAARLIALFLGVAAGIACAAVVIADRPHTVWLATAVVVLGIPTPGLTERSILWRMIGQVAACTIVAIVTWLIVTSGFADPSPLFGAAIVIALLCYLTSLGSGPAIEIACLSTALLLPVAAKENTQIGEIVLDRLADNLIGLGIVAVALAAIRRWASEVEGELREDLASTLATPAMPASE